MITRILRNRLIVRPLLLSSITRNFAGLEHTIRFYELVKEYLPEEHARLLLLKPADAADQFVKVFSKRYFPIQNRRTLSYSNEETIIPLKELTQHIPAALESFDRWSYDSGQIPAGRLLASAILSNPYEGRTSRVALMDRFQKKTGAVVVGLIHEKGYALNRVEAALKDSPYPGLLAWCRFIFSKTGNLWLDDRYKNYSWNRKDVKRLTHDYPLYVEMEKQMKAFTVWLDEDDKEGFPARCRKVIKYVKDRIEKQGKPLAEIFTEAKGELNAV